MNEENVHIYRMEYVIFDFVRATQIKFNLIKYGCFHP